MDKSKLELTPFVTTKSQRDRPRWADAPSYVRTKGRTARTRSMWVKIGVCMVVLTGVILFEVFLINRGSEEEPAVQAAATEDATGTESEDTLGRLRFVQAGGVTSVFKVSQRWNAPVSILAKDKLEDNTLLRLTAEPGSAVQASAAGEVVAVSADDELGPYVRISHGSDLESVYYGLSDITVEAGQPLSPMDTLGKVSAGGTLYVRMRRAGSPIDPEDFIDTSGVS
jgi:murein DD-endopeptidase MepM/ murein hydrolase activator NlpD